MALDVATGTFNTGTGAATTTVSVAGLSFTPKVVLFFWAGRTATGQAEGDHKFGAGYMVGLADRGGATSQSDHGAAATAADNQVFDNACIKLQTITGAVDGAADFSSFNSDGFTIIIDDAFTASYLIHYLAIGGSDLTNVASVTVAEPGATGNQNITTVGFQPDCAIGFMGGHGAVNAADTFSSWGIGVAAGSTPNGAILIGNSDDGAGTSETMSYCRAGEFLAGCFTNAVSDRATLTAWLSNGFTLNWAERTAGFNARVLCLKGGSYVVGDILSQTGTSNTAETGVGFTPKALLVGSHNKTQSTSDTTQNGDERSLGFATGAASRSAAGIHDKDALGTIDIGVDQRTDAMYTNQSTAATTVVEGLMDLVSLDSDGFTFVMDDADPAQAFVWYLAMGDAVTTGSAISSDGAATATMASASIAAAAASMDGAAVMTMTGAAISGSVISADGAALLTAAGAAVASGVIASDGSAAMDMVGASQAAADLSADGAGTMDMEGAATADSAISADGAATVVLVGAAISAGGTTEEGAFSADGASTMDLAGAAIAAGDVQSDAQAVTTLDGASIAAGDISVEGVGTVTLSSESAVSASQITRSGWKPRRKQLPNDAELVAVLTAIGPYIDIVNRGGDVDGAVVEVKH